jgi:hypothetical protein
MIPVKYTIFLIKLRGVERRNFRLNVFTVLMCKIITSSMFAPYGLNYRMLNAYNKIWINKTEV